MKRTRTPYYTGMRTHYTVIETQTVTTVWEVAIEGNEEDAYGYAVSSESPLPTITKRDVQHVSIPRYHFTQEA